MMAKVKKLFGIKEPKAAGFSLGKPSKKSVMPKLKKKGINIPLKLKKTAE